MTAISHALIGASLAAGIPHPAVAVAASLVAHFVCDAIPHWDIGTNWRLRPKVITGSLAILENIFALWGLFFLFSPFIRNQTVLFLCLAASLVPDWLEAPYYLFPKSAPKIFYHIYKFQSRFHGRLQPPVGILIQIAVVSLFLIFGFAA